MIKRMRFLAILPLVVASLVPTAAEGASTATMRQLAGPIPNPLVQPVGLVKVGNALFERHITGSANGMGRAARFKTTRVIKPGNARSSATSSSVVMTAPKPRRD